MFNFLFNRNQFLIGQISCEMLSKVLLLFLIFFVQVTFTKENLSITSTYLGYQTLFFHTSTGTTYVAGSNNVIFYFFFFILIFTCRTENLELVKVFQRFLHQKTSLLFITLLKCTPTTTLFS